MVLCANLMEVAAVRYTPAGIPAINFRVAHASTQIEAGDGRQVECEIPCVAMGTMAHLLATARPGDALKLTGFLAAKSLKSRIPVLHVNELQFVEGINHGV